MIKLCFRTSSDLVVRIILLLAAILLAIAPVSSAQGLLAHPGLIQASYVEQQPYLAPEFAEVPLVEQQQYVDSSYEPPFSGTYSRRSSPADDLHWIDSVRVGYDEGFVIAADREVDLNTGRSPFRMRINGWGQLRNTVSEVRPPNRDIRQFQLKRGRLIFRGSAFNPDFKYFVQLDGRSTSGDDFRLLDYFLRWDLGHARFGWDPGTLVLRAGKYKMPFTLARWVSGKEFEFSDRSMASTFFDVNRSLAWGLYGRTSALGFPLVWETALFNGLVTGGAETGSSGTLDENFAYSARLFAFPIGDWGTWELADYEWHRCPAMRVGAAFAASDISITGLDEFRTLRVVDSGDLLADVLPAGVTDYRVALFSIDASLKYRGWSFIFEHYFRNVTDIRGADVPDLFDHGFWLQAGYFIIPQSVQLLARWSRVEGRSGTLGVAEQSSEEIAAGFAWYARENHAKLTVDFTFLDGAPIDSAVLDITPGDDGQLLRTQVQFSF